MKKFTFCVTALIFATIVMCCSLVARVAEAGSASASVPFKKSLRAFRSEQELNDYLQRLVKKRRKSGHGSGFGNGDSLASNSAGKAVSETVDVSAAPSAKDESITNVQQAGVDEGGIVKLHGDQLVV